MYVHCQENKKTYNLAEHDYNTSPKEVFSAVTHNTFSLLEGVQETQATSEKNRELAKMRGNFSLGIFCLCIVTTQTI